MKKTTCSFKDCENPRRAYNQRYCLQHHSAWNSLHSKNKANRTPYEAMKAHARSSANNARRDGKLIPEPCKCGSVHVEMHHPDYTKPLEIVWICRVCHLELHENERKEAELLQCG